MSRPIVFPGVKLGRNVQLSEYVILGNPTRNGADVAEDTSIGDDSIVRSHTVIYAGNRIGTNFQTGHHVTIRECSEIGNNVSIGTGSVIEHHVGIAEGCRFHGQTFIPEYTICEENVWVGPNAVLTNALYPAAPDTKENLRSVVLKRGAKIGANSTILPGITIGEHALVGAGSVVTKSVAPYTVVVGNPAKPINTVDNISHYRPITR